MKARKARARPAVKDPTGKRTTDALRQEARAERAEAKVAVRDKRIAYLEGQLQKVRKAARE